MPDSEVPQAAAAAGEGGGDHLPEELDVTAFVGPYAFPDISRRRIAAILYLVTGTVCVAAGLAWRNGGLLAAAGLLAVIAGYHFACAWPLRVRELDALVEAGRSVGFPVGHASAQLAWRGLRSRPVWRLLLFSAEDPPTRRGLVEIDAVDGAVLHSAEHENPEVWA